MVSSNQSEALYHEIEELKERLSQALKEIECLQSLLVEYGKKMVTAGENFSSTLLLDKMARK